MTDSRRLLSPEKREDDVDASIRPLSLGDFTGQAAARANLQVFINAAKTRGDALDHVLFVGPPGLGKTTLAQIVARELGVNFRSTSGPVIAKAGDLAAQLTNLEERALNSEEAGALAAVDLVLSTGAIGYVGAPTFNRILDASRNRPWFAVFALRMFPVARIVAALTRRGYAVFKLDGETFRQRRFASPGERDEVMARLADLGVDPTSRESDGWLHAEFFLARPEGEPSGLSLPGLRPA